MTDSGRAPLLVASNRGPLTVEVVEDGDDEVRRGSGGLVSGMQTALSAVPDAVWVCAAMNDRERALARQAPNGHISELPLVADALRGDFDVRMLPIDPQTFRNAYNGIANSTLWFVLHRLYDLPTATGLRRQLAPAVGRLRALQPGVRTRVGRRCRARGQGHGAGLPPVPGAADAARPALGRADRVLHPHAVGAVGVPRHAAR